MGQAPERLVEIWAEPGPSRGREGAGRGRSGSGWVVGERGVLTARHVVVSGDGPLQVIQARPGKASRGEDWHDCTVAWDDPELDVALLRIEDPHWSVPGEPCVLADVGDQSLDGETVGFPDAQRRRVGDRDVEQARGALLPVMGVRSGRAGFDVATSVPKDRRLWMGMSGAAVRDTDGRLVAVVTDAHPDRQQRRLGVALLHDVAAREEFVRAAREVGLEPRLAEPWRVMAGVAASAQALAGLPPAPVGFAGREEESRELLELLAPGAGEGAGAGTVVVAGLPGVGKTALTLQVAHQALRRGWFPGGVLFVDLRGYDPVLAPVEPSGALQAALRGLGVPDKDLPPTMEEQRARCRSVLASMDARGQSVLLVLDNASSAGQVEALLPGAGGHRAVVTSRESMPGLEARLLEVPVMDDGQALAVLDKALRIAHPGDDRITAHLREAGRLAGLCGYLPVALLIVAALLKLDRGMSVDDLVCDLGDARTRLDALAYDDPQQPVEVRTVFEVSYRRLREDQARLFRLFPLNPGPELSLDAATALTGQSRPVTRRALQGLSAAHLIQPGTAGGRWAMHDLVRVFAGEHARQTADTDQPQAALERLLAYYTTTTDAADDWLSALAGDTPSEVFPDREAALAWLDLERPNLVGAVTLTHTHQDHETVFTLATALARFLHWRRHFDDQLRTAEQALDAARALHDQQREAGALNNLGTALQGARHFDDAITAHRRAADLFHDAHGQAHALTNLGNALREVGTAA